MLYYYCINLLFPFQLPIISPFCVRCVALPVSASLPGVHVIPTHSCFMPISKFSFFTNYRYVFPYSLLRCHTFRFISSDRISLPSCSISIDVCLRVSLLALIASFTSSSHRFTALLHTVNIFHMTLLAVFLTNCSHPSTILGSALSLSISFILVTMHTLSNSSRIDLPSGHLFLGLLLLFFYLQFIYLACTISHRAYMCDGSGPWFPRPLHRRPFSTTVQSRIGRSSFRMHLSSPFWRWLFYFVV